MDIDREIEKVRSRLIAEYDRDFPDREVGSVSQEENSQDLEMPTEFNPWRHRNERMRCATCMWYVVKLGSGTPPIGRCRRHAPTMNGYPVVFETDWCGDHEDRIG